MRYIFNAGKSLYREDIDYVIQQTVIKSLTKKFGVLPEDIREKISKLDAITLEIIIEDIFEYKSLEDINKYIL